MENENPTPEDEMKAENELLRLKLELEHGMQDSETNLPPEAENEWLNYIYNFEQQHKNAKRIKVYDFIGKPEFIKLEDLKDEEVEAELDRLMEIMNSKGVSLDVICEYPVGVIYKFVTEELFDRETDDIRIAGMMSCFCYEEFHPNHEYDLERYSREYAESIFSKKWSKEFGFYTAADTITFNGKNLTKEELSDKIFSFQELHKNITLVDFKVTRLQFSVEDWQAKVQTELKIVLEFENGEVNELQQNAIFYYQSEYDYWELYKLELEDMNF